MFLIRLSRPQRMAFLSLARELVKADSVATVGEMTRLAQIGRELDLDAEAASQQLSVDEAAQVMDGEAAQMITLLELAALSRADRKISPLESGLIGRLAVTWRIDRRQMEAIDAWAVRHRRLLDDGLDLIVGGS